MATHRVNWNLHMGPDIYHEGDEITLNAEKAAELEAFGVVTPLEEKLTVDSEQSAEKAALSTDELQKKNKVQLASYAKDRFGVDLDSVEMTKKELLQKIAELEAK